MEFESLNKIYERSFRENWDLEAVSNYQGDTLHYRDVARMIAKMHIMYERCGLQKGDKVAICARNQANWIVALLSVITYGAVAVPILHEFKPGNVHHLLNHSDSKALFVDDFVWEGLNEAEMPEIRTVINLNRFELIFAREKGITENWKHIDEWFEEKYPSGISAEDIDYYEDSAEEVAMINYTSGTSGFSKGVMIPYRALWSNVAFAWEVLPEMRSGSKVVVMLPAAHMYGMMFEVLYELTIGAHIYFLTKAPSPKIIMQAMADVRPDLIISVPLIIEKIYKSRLKPLLEKGGIRFAMMLPGINNLVQKKIRDELIETFGGRFHQLIVGGAAFNKEVEEFFKKIHFPVAVGYGMTECAPIISYDHWKVNKLYSCGKAAPRLEIRIDSDDPVNVAGEILVRGANVFLGYYKNEEATKAAFTDDGWFKTGDMGVMDEDGCLFIRGRCKCMILGPSGQNIYPEEIESVLNNLPYVVDSLVIEDAGMLKALIYPDFHQGEQDGMDATALEAKIRTLIDSVNEVLPNYSRIKRMELLPEDFERTPKKSIKRYLYQRS
ncbi:MAG: AMP-binding protein [Bacteroidales bacterium]|nr:AMP-binding protein [Bacteroidales bacterium]